MRSRGIVSLSVSALLFSVITATGVAHEGGEICRHGKLEHFMSSSAGAPDRAWDEDTGQDRRTFPPDRVVDLLHMKLQMRFDDLDVPIFTATETLQFVPIAGPVSTLTLDAVGLQIKAVRTAENVTDFYQDDESITFLFNPPLSPDREHELIIDYVCEEPYDGLFFTPSSPDAPGYSAEVHTQGQTNSNRHWFICHDYPNERLSTELIVNVPAEYAVSSNGRLVSKLGSGDRVNWHWLQEKPHVAYLVSLVIGKFDIVEIPHDRVPMQVWVPEGLGDQVMQTYGRTGEMIDVFEARFGVPYPWDRYDQLVVKNFRAGGMENTSATSMYPTAIFDERALLDRDLESLIAHELAHQWTGDYITCKSWAHIWLNEGWATYGESLWFEARDGQDGYLDDVRANFRVARRDRTSDDVGMVSSVYQHPDETFRRRANPYPKGASVLHMLRMMLGEEAFWAGVQVYMERHALGTVETSDLRYALEETSGRGLEWFFDQWCHRPGSPNLDISVRYEPTDSQLRIELEQTQQIDARTPAFRFTLPIAVITDDGKTMLNMEVTEKTATMTAPVSGVPRVVAIDPELHVLKTMKADKPLGMWLAQAKQGPTITARHQALDALGEYDTPEAVELVSSIIRDDDEPHTLRRTAVGTLRKYGSTSAKSTLLSLLNEDIPQARVRASLVSGARGLEKDDVIEKLATLADTDRSYAVRAEAIRVLAHHEAKDHVDLIAELVHYPSQHQQVRGAALDALAKLKDERGLDLAIQYAAYGHTDRARSTAIRMIGEMHEQDTDRAVEVLLAMIDDPEARAREAAISALAKTKDDRAKAPLQAIADSHPNPSYKRRAERALESMEKTE